MLIIGIFTASAGERVQVQVQESGSIIVRAAPHYVSGTRFLMVAAKMRILSSPRN